MQWNSLKQPASFPGVGLEHSGWILYFLSAKSFKKLKAVVRCLLHSFTVQGEAPFHDTVDSSADRGLSATG